jgi:hypothetical protein
MEPNLLDISHYSNYSNDTKKKESIGHMTKNIIFVAVPAIVAMAFAILV